MIWDPVIREDATASNAVTTKMSDFQKLLEIARAEIAAFISELPPEVRTHAQGVPVIFHRAPTLHLTGLQDFEGILGLFVGDSLLEGQLAGQGQPPSILLFLEELWDFAGQEESAFREEIRVTYAHELGHYLGWDEEDLEERGLD